MRSVGLLFLCLSAVHALSPLGADLVLPTESIPEECRAQAAPLQHVLRLSLHDQRHLVHVQCRRSLHAERENHRRELLSIKQSKVECHKMAARIRAANPSEASDLIQQCDITAERLSQDRAFVNAIAQVHRNCEQSLRRINVDVRRSTVQLMEVLASCSRPDACRLYRLIKMGILANVDQIHSEASGDVKTICRATPLHHDLRRACERFNLTSGILIDAVNALPQDLHIRLSDLCTARPRTEPPTTRRVVRTRPVEVETTKLVEVETAQKPKPKKAHPIVIKISKAIAKAVTTLKPKTEKPVQGIPGWDGQFMGVGPVLLKPLPSKADPDTNKEETDKEPHPHHHSHHHHSLTIGMIAAVAVLCVIVTILSALLTGMILKRRNLRSNDREVKVPLTDEDQLEAIKTKGYENPTYAFFEGTEE